ncbi:MAG: alpha-amylase family glycosyl hydrolase [Moritella sp.]|uniref:alpha-amylase family glycosyl hydrolase n=1 Tax=Moritella sp. TaxID=78556 RepID=UPI0029A97E88|nr:alpha-amylase family glycosyl hydrolase [Moritella sp.]MDX2319531.1 alpha-amylase family glycosyl hydrolase [Moritella sp.]
MNKYNKLAFISLCTLILWACEPSDVRSAAQVDARLAQPKVAKISEQLPPYLTRDIREEVFYFVMPDRFINGDKSNDNGSKTLVESQGGFDPSSKSHYHGGDIIGLKEKLPYLQEMGITSIWMTPIMRNQAMQGDSSGYHGYWVLDFTAIDPHLGSAQDLKDLIDAAHALNMKVFFDIIANHSADVIKFKECHGEDGKQWLGETEGLCDYKTLEQVANGDTYSTFVSPGSEDIKTPQWLNDPKFYHNQGDSTWEGESAIYGDFAGLDDIDTDNPEVVKGLIDVFKGVVSEFKPDGFRIDTVKHVNMEFWSEFSPAIVEHAKSLGIPQFFMFGEVYDFTPEVLSQFTTTGNMQSILDFGFQSAVFQTLVERKGTDVLAMLFAGDHHYKDADSDASQLVTFTGNHDMGRFAHLLDVAKFEMDEAEKLARVKLSNALMYFSRGIPVVYYGDEQGFVGDGHDKDSRQDMMPSLVASFNDDDLLGTDKTTADSNFDQSHELYQDLVALAQLYLDHPALRNGQQAQVYAQSTPGLYAFTRTLDNKQYLIVANTATTDQSQTFTMNYQGYEPVVLAKDKTEQDGVVTINLAPLSYAVFKAKK